MTVKELKERLSDYPDDMTVTIEENGAHYAGNEIAYDLMSVKYKNLLKRGYHDYIRPVNQHSETVLVLCVEV